MAFWSGRTVAFPLDQHVLVEGASVKVNIEVVPIGNIYDFSNSTTLL